MLLSSYEFVAMVFVVLSEMSVYRYEKRHSNIPAHISPCFRVKEGDHVTIGQCRLVLHPHFKCHGLPELVEYIFDGHVYCLCRPLSKTVRFNVLKVIPAGSGGGKKAFTGM